MSSIEYKGMDPEAMYWYDRVFQKRAEDSLSDVPIFTNVGEREVLQMIQRSISRQNQRPVTLEESMRIYEKERQRTPIQGIRGETI